MSHIFISYSRKDKDCVDQVYNRLTDSDFPVWIDRRKIPAMSDWVKEIIKGIQDAEIFLLLWSANAKDSKYVQEEMNIALNQSFGTHKRLKIMTVRLDDTPYPAEFTHKQGFDLINGCTDHHLSELIDQLPEELRKFSYEKTLEKQNMQMVANTPFGRVAYDRDALWGFKADIAGPRDKRLPNPPDLLHVGLQFTRSTGLNLIEDIHKAIGKDTDPVWLLHIMGITNNDGNEYRLDPDNLAQWQASCDYIQRIIKQVADEKHTTLRIFAPIPAALLAGAMRGFERFWHVQLYHYEPSKKGYILALDQERR